ncbi:hypothetical protein [Bacillus sp. TH25]|uniref:hypothetical protein n=1 Tax=Bacillus sp. TH25 TaxID=2796391 RepID=UPI001913E892|nr:hypothetical protein [Bacillus sp. TH25]MBK5435269.1 hypothetical protein [Bacillus sp. TH25]
MNKNAILIEKAVGEMKVVVTMNSFGVTTSEEIEINDPEKVDREVEQYVREQISYDYEIVEE